MLGDDNILYKLTIVLGEIHPYQLKIGPYNICLLYLITINFHSHSNILF